MSDERVIADCELGVEERVPLTAEDEAQRQRDKVAAEEMAWQEFRAERDRRLYESDFTQTADVPIGEPSRAAWATYRQQLRDLPAATTDPFNPTWPEKP